ncbi:conjugal transfer protein (plasmid) [Leuconostoc mesenteroides]|uniref:conjugal transfer protein n=1 Tax=Leuconostoc mesenteroides TaxID=1245 RepID=UPI0021154A9C|nr:conjugal transfer protein [Leuconostoc mesenteroides]UUE16931.1 conjugal transfer protein [Leuconostoc mesenteroides]
MFDKLKSIKKGYVKSRDKPDQSLPYAKVQKRGKWIRRFVKIALVLVGLSGAIAFIKASTVSRTNHKLIAKMKTYDDKLEKASMGQSVYSPNLNRYAQGFFQTYFTQSDNDDDRQKRLKFLKKYFATNISSTIYDNQDSQKETYVGSRLLNTFTKNDVKIAQYQVGYTVGNDKNTIIRVFNLPFAQKAGQYTVLALPYATNEQDIVGHVGKIDQDESNNANLASSDKVQAFVKAFSEKYVSSKASDMSLIMKEPEGLEGQYAVKSIDQVNVSGVKDSMNIKYLLTLTDTETKLEHSEQITLTVSPKGSTYYVVKMIHTQGGLLN